jgi:hypothetical protein
LPPSPSNPDGASQIKTNGEEVIFISYISKPKFEILDNLDLILSKVFPLQVRRQIKSLLKSSSDLNQFREENLDQVEGLIIRISRCKRFDEMSNQMLNVSLPVQACLWERFAFLIQFVKQNPEDPQLVPTPIGRYLREGLSALWHSYLEEQSIE